MQDFDASQKTVQQYSQTLSSKHIRQTRQKEEFIWINWVFTVSALFALSAVSFAFDWPTVITCILILLTSLYSFFLALMALLLFEKDAFN